MKLEEFKEILKTGNYEDIKPLLRLEVRNKANLHPTMYYRDIIGDIVQVITVHVKFDDGRQATSILTNGILNHMVDNGVSMFDIVQDARENTPRDFKCTKLSDMYKNIKEHHTLLILEDNTIDSIDTLVSSGDMIDSVIVVSINTITRVNILQFRSLLRKVHDKIGDYFIIPSSVYEVLIIPADKVDDIDSINNLIEYVNNTTVEDKDVLGHKLLKYDNSGLSEC